MKKMIQETLRALEGVEAPNAPKFDPGAGAIFIRLGALSRQLATFHARTLKDEGLPASEYQLLALLLARGPQAPRELNKLLLLTTGALTSALDRLQSGGYVRRRPNPEDARSVLVELTAIGKKLADGVLTLEMDAQSRQLAPLGQTEKREIVAALDRLIDVL